MLTDVKNTTAAKWDASWVACCGTLGCNVGNGTAPGAMRPITAGTADQSCRSVSGVAVRP